MGGLATGEEGSTSRGTIVAVVLLIGCMVFVFVPAGHDPGLLDRGPRLPSFLDPAGAGLDDIRTEIRDKVRTIRNRRGEPVYASNRLELVLQNMADSAEAILNRHEDDIETLEKTDDILKSVIESVASAPSIAAASPRIRSLYDELQRVEAGG